MNGDTVRAEWPEGTAVNFKPKGWLNGEALNGIVTGHIYAEVLIIKTASAEWFCSVYRCEKSK